jgi:hypothetical protein
MARWALVKNETVINIAEFDSNWNSDGIVPGEVETSI